MALLNKLFSAKSGSALGGKKSNKAEEKELAAPKKIETKIDKPVAVFPPKADQPWAEKSSILISPFNTEKALSGQSLNQYTFKVSPSANKIDIAKEVKRTYNVKAVSVNIINIPKKARRVGRTLGFKAGYKKAIVTLAKGQTIEIK